MDGTARGIAGEARVGRKLPRLCNLANRALPRGLVACVLEELDCAAVLHCCALPNLQTSACVRSRAHSRLACTLTGTSRISALPPVVTASLMCVYGCFPSILLGIRLWKYQTHASSVPPPALPRIYRIYRISLPHLPHLLYRISSTASTASLYHIYRISRCCQTKRPEKKAKKENRI